MEELSRQVRRAQWRLTLQRFVGALGGCLTAALVIAVVLIVVDKFWPLGVAAWAWGAGAVGLGFVVALGWAVFSGRGRLDAAVELDRRFGLKERVSSSLALAPEELDTEAGQAVVADAVRRVSRLEVGEHFKVAPSRQLLLPLVPAIAAVLVALLVSPAGVPTAQAKTQVEDTKKQVKSSTESLRQKLAEQRKAAEKEGLKEANELLKALQRGADELAQKPPEERRDALTKLNDLSRDIQKRREALGGAEQVQKQFNQLKDISRGPGDRFADAVAKGDFEKAVQELQKLQNDLANGKLNEKEQKELAAQLEQMQQKLQKLADAHQKAQEDLKKQIEQAKQMGQQEQAQQLQRQLDQLQQQGPQMQQLQQMAQKLGQCAQCAKNGQMQNAAQQLGQMQQQIANLQEQLKEAEMLQMAEDGLRMAREQMNCPECNGMGCEKCQGGMRGDKPGKKGKGLGAGRGEGDRPEKESDGKFYNTQPKQQIGKGAADVTGEVEGPNAKGNVQQSLQEQMQADEHEETDPLSNQQMPRKHREHAKEYFDRFREGQ